MTIAQSDPFHSPDDAQAQAERYFASRRGKLSLWTGVLGGALVWATQMQIGYVLARFTAAQPGLGTAHHATAVIALLLAAGATVLAWRDWRRVGGGEPAGTEPGIAGRSRFLAALGILTSGLFTLVILAQWLPIFFIDPGWY
jgi:hypothetical protein